MQDIYNVYIFKFIKVLAYTGNMANELPATTKLYDYCTAKLHLDLVVSMRSVQLFHKKPRFHNQFQQLSELVL